MNQHSRIDERKKTPTAIDLESLRSLLNPKNWFPFLSTLRSYRLGVLRLDLVAGLTVALVALPQALAYAYIAGVEPKYGLYAVMVGSILGALFGSSRHLHTGPVNAVSIVIAATMAPYVQREDFMALVFLLALLSGVFKLAAGLLRLGNLTQFMSRSVLVGFTCGAALLIIINQIPNLLGLPKITSAPIPEYLHSIATSLSDLNVAAILIGVGVVWLVIFLNRNSPKTATGVHIIPSYFIAMLAAACVVAVLGLGDQLAVVGKISAALPPVSNPALDFQSMRLLGAGALALALISISEVVASAKTTASLSGDKFNANQELVGQGLANIGVAFLSGIPVSGSFTRTVLSYRAGGQTRFAAVYSGVLLVIIVGLFSPIVQYIPVAALAGIIVIIAVQMVNWKHVKLALKTTRSDASVMLATFVSTLIFSLDTAIYIGVGLSLVLFLRKAQYPRLIELAYDENDGFQEISGEKRHIPEISIIHIEGDVFFGAAEFLENEIGRIANRPDLKVLILRMKSSCCLDATSILSLIQLNEQMQKQDRLLIISGVTGEVERVFRRSGLDKILGDRNIYFSDTAVLRSTRKALSRALEYVNATGEEQYRVSLFYDRPEKAKISPEKAESESAEEQKT